MALALGVVVIPLWNRGSTVEAVRPAPPSPAVEREAALAMRVSHLLRIEAPHLEAAERDAIREHVLAAAFDHDVDPLFILALMRAESGFRPRAVSPQGAVGLMQLVPTTAQWFARRSGTPWDAHFSLYDPGVNIRLGTGYFAYLFRKFRDVRLSLRAYHVGPGTVDREVPGESKFASRVLAEYRRYRTIAACETAACPGDVDWKIRGRSAEMAAACLDAARFCG